VTDRPLSILHVLAPADVGGLESVVRSLALGHTGMGHSVRIAAVLDVATNPFVQEARDAGLAVEVIHSPARSFLPERRAIRALLTDTRVDVLHSHGYRSDILDLGVARSMAVPSVTTLHGFSATDRKARTYEWLQIRAARRASAIVAVSTNVAGRVLASGARPELVHVIRNAASDTSHAIPRDAARERLGLDDGMHVGWIGRLSAEKGPDVMLDAMQYLTDLPLTLSFIGDGPDRSTLSARAEQAGVAHSVRFHGRVADAASLLNAFDVLAISSRTEGTPMVILEAMGSETPIVATSVGGIPDMLSSAEALLVPSEDSRALASAIRAALGDRDASAERAARAHARLAAEFGMQPWLARYEALYRSIQPPSREAQR
jgi:glycosyltransferase involved in cell wall biosynthesis